MCNKHTAQVTRVALPGSSAISVKSTLNLAEIMCWRSSAKSAQIDCYVISLSAALLVTFHYRVLAILRNTAIA